MPTPKQKVRFLIDVEVKAQGEVSFSAKAGEVKELSASSAQRWLRRGSATTQLIDKVAEAKKLEEAEAAEKAEAEAKAEAAEKAAKEKVVADKAAKAAQNKSAAAKPAK